MTSTLQGNRRNYALCFTLCLLAFTVSETSKAQSAATTDPLPIFDAHLHYSHDAVATLGTDQVLALMREAKLKRALVSSSDDEGTQKLYAAAPDLIIPSLRPYRLRSDASTWTKEPSIITYLEQRLAKYRYAAIGEFHLYGADADLPVPRKMIALSQQFQLILHAHSDTEAIERIFKQAPSATVLWAHSGFDRPEQVRDMLRKYPRLFADLAYRTDQASPEWTLAFKEFPERFVVGTDSFTPERLFYIPEHAKFSREWLKALPRDLAEKIAWRNGETLLARFWKTAGGQDCPKTQATQSNQTVVRLEGKESRLDLFIPTIRVGEAFDVQSSICPLSAGHSITRVNIDASMPEHQHGMNYRPRTQLSADKPGLSPERQFLAKGLVFHMPGRWQIDLVITGQNDQGQAWRSPDRIRYDIQIK